MNKYLMMASVCTLAACGGNPLDGVGGGAPTGSGVCNGTTIVCMDEANQFTYNPTTDRIKINNLPFDLDGTYSPVAGVDINGHQVYRNDAGAHSYYAIYIAGDSTSVGAGVAATADYLGFGYSGTMFRGNDTTNFPSEGEATYEGDYAGIRVYDGPATDVRYSSGDIEMTVDFEDFDGTGAITGGVFNRREYDRNGNSTGALPSLVVTDTTFENGIIKETEIAEFGNDTNAGTLAGIFGGSDGKQIAGVLVLEGPVTDGATATVRETGAFVLDRVSLILP